MYKRLGILGSTGSVGRQSVEVAKKYNVHISLLHAHSRVDELFEQFLAVDPDYVCITSEYALDDFKRKFKGFEDRLISGKQALFNQWDQMGLDGLINAIYGFEGLEYSVKSLRSKNPLILANKESLVAAGEMIMKTIKKDSIKLIPLDSEHWALNKLLAQIDLKQVKKVILPASGGPFWNKSQKMIEQATNKNVLDHPVWDMGGGITVNSANMINKAFELLEAHYLFNIPIEMFEVKIHPKAFVHGVLQKKDGTYLLLQSAADMRIPIADALSVKKDYDVLTLSPNEWSARSGDFYEVDQVKFPMLQWYKMMIQQKGTLPCAINAANQVAVAAFLSEKIKFVNIRYVIEQTLKNISYIKDPSLVDIQNTHKQATAVAQRITKEI